MGGLEDRIRLLLRNIETLETDEEWRGFRDALREDQPDAYADERIGRALAARRAVLLERMR